MESPRRTRAHHREDVADERERVYFRDKSYEADFKLLQKQFPGKDFDFGSSTKDEKLWLVSVVSDTEPGESYLFDRQTKKDAFYLYKANWSTDPFVYLTSRRFTTLPRSARTIKVYSNAAMVDVKVNGTSLGAKAAAERLEGGIVDLSIGTPCDPPPPEVIDSWGAAAPPGFQFAVRAPNRVGVELSMGKNPLRAMAA